MTSEVTRIARPDGGGLHFQRNGKGVEKDKGKGKAKHQSPTHMTKSATCAERKVTSHVTVGHESTKTKE